jgi:hypothetical protein
MEHAETMSQDVLRRLRVQVRDQATVGAAEHGVSTHVFTCPQLEQVFVVHSSPICDNSNSG